MLVRRAPSYLGMKETREVKSAEVVIKYGNAFRANGKQTGEVWKCFLGASRDISPRGFPAHLTYWQYLAMTVECASMSLSRS